jgi:CubicO group peptidase (beta-lactamase class C family)
MILLDNPMKKSRFRFLSIGLLVSSILISPALSASEFVTALPETVGMSSERLERLSQTFQEYVDDEKLPGSAILVARRGKIAFFDTFGFRDIESKDPMGKDAIFRIASQSKALISVGVMILQEEGKLLMGTNGNMGYSLTDHIGNTCSC